MAEHLILADPQSARDALTFAGRAKQVGDEAVRLQASRGTLAMYAAALTPRGLFDGTPLILVLRVLRADPELECDLTVDSLTETIDPRALRLPDLAVARSWAAVDVPRCGWTRTEEIPATVIRELAQATPTSPKPSRSTLDRTSSARCAAESGESRPKNSPNSPRESHSRPRPSDFSVSRVSGPPSGAPAGGLG